jgi:hypothetical protein
MKLSKSFQCAKEFVNHCSTSAKGKEKQVKNGDFQNVCIAFNILIHFVFYNIVYCFWWSTANVLLQKLILQLEFGVHILCYFTCHEVTCMLRSQNFSIEFSVNEVCQVQYLASCKTVEV